MTPVKKPLAAAIADALAYPPLAGLHGCLQGAFLYAGLSKRRQESKTAKGTAVDIDSTGALVVQSGESTRVTLRSGEVALLPEAL